MSGSTRLLAAVRAVAPNARSLRMESASIVTGDGGSVWRVTPCPFPGTGEGGCPEILIVAPLATDNPDAAVWLADFPDEGFVRLDNAVSLEALLQGCPGLPPLTVASLVAVLLGPHGAERVLETDDQVESLLAELAPQVPVRERPLAFTPGIGGSWSLGFLAARLAASGEDRLHRLTVARWDVTLRSGHLSWHRKELVVEAVLDRYRP